MHKIKKQSWITPKAEVRESPVEGKGLFAVEAIRKGEKILTFGGNYTDKIGSEKAEKEGKLIMQWDEDLYSYEDRGDNDTYFVNHSCDSNSWMEDTFSLSARRDISVGEEITADYVLWEAYANFVSKWQCKCGFSQCRGKVTGNDWKDPQVQEQYEGHFSPLINKRIEQQTK